jgi:16S rRNA (adenine1518-N6/adenine1519-N6)-dimethyltransferase
VAGPKLGQHFLANRETLERLAEAACPTPEPLVIEIGSGRGALTEFLLPRAGRVVAIELDSVLANALRVRFPRAEVVEADVLATDLAQWGPAAVAGNLPYYITSPILERICALGPLLKRAVVLMQREVAARLVAKPGTRDYGFLTVATQLFTEPEVLFRIPPGAFSPPPKVESAAVRLVPRPVRIQDAGGFLEFAGRSFRQKRKTLRNNLLPFYGRQVESWPEARLRAEQVPIEQLIEMYGRLG